MISGAQAHFRCGRRCNGNVFNFPSLPTTTIGSFPQTPEIRQARAAFRKGELGNLQYLEAMRKEIRLAIKKQEEIGLDVLVHGEAERNDMVEYFGEQLWGYAFTENGWVQSYGSRCVKPPDSIWRYLPTRTDDGGLDSVCAEPDRKAGQRHVDRTHHHADVVVRA